ncbi:MAG: ABC transporter ATP-binding protein [Clostridia bacterium]|nr:ABC transporter ATP-binding protein [Clostridia bacterium]
MNNNVNKVSSMKRLIKYIFSHNKVAMTAVITSIFVSAVASSASGIFLFLLINNVITPALSSGFSSVVGTFVSIIVSMAVVYGLGVLSSFIYSFVIAKLGQSTLNSLRKDMFAKMEMLPVSYFDSNKHGDIMSYYTNDIDAIRQFISQSMIQIINTVFTLVILTVAMLIISIWLTIVVYVSAVVMVFIIKRIGGKATVNFVKQQDSTAKLEGFIEEIIGGEKVVKVFTHEAASTADFRKLNHVVKDDSVKANEFGNIVMPILSSIGNYMYVLIAVVGGIFCLISGFKNLSLTGFSAMNAAVIVSFLSMSRSFGQSIAQVSQQTSMCAMAFAGADRVFALIDEEPEYDDGAITLVNVRKTSDGTLSECTERTETWGWKGVNSNGETILTELNGNIVLNHVDFGYVADEIVLHDICINAKAGEKMAFVGATGAGKTTITNLINRFYDVADGSIFYDGINIKDIKKADLRRSLTVVLQDTNLFTGTVKENISYGKLDANDEEIYSAAKTANAYDFIEKLPNGFGTMLSSDGANLSQGQRQLLSIARASIADTPLLILDEATSSIDTRTEKLVQKGTDKLMDGRTVFVIAHRLSTVRSSDMILVLDHGRIIEEGNHKELISKQGTYYQLYTGAFELE